MRHSGSWEVSPRQRVYQIPDLSPGQLLAVSIYPEKVHGGARASTWALTVDSEGWTGADLLTHLPILLNRSSQTENVFVLKAKTDHLEFYRCGKHLLSYIWGRWWEGNTKLNLNPPTSWEMSGDQYHVDRSVCEREFQ